MRQVIVDANDAVIGAKERDALTSSDIYRVSALWMTDSSGRVLLARRALSKKINPGMWGPAVAGTVDEGEDYDANIEKEIREEIGLELSLSELRIGPKVRISRNERNYFIQWYLYTFDVKAEELAISSDEVAEVCWFTKDEIRRMFREHPEEITPAAAQWLPLFIAL